jgi:hypothetical protein
LVDEILLDEADLVEEDAKDLELVIEAELATLEFDHTGGRDMMEEYSEVGFGVGVGSVVGVDEAPGPSPSQVIL